MELNFKGKLYAFFIYAAFLFYCGLIFRAEAQDCSCVEDAEYVGEGKEINLEIEQTREQEEEDYLRRETEDKEEIKSYENEENSYQ